VVKAPVTREQREEGMDILAEMDDVEFEYDGDAAVLMWWPLASGQVQPVIWPMRLHVHSAECWNV